MLLRLILSLTIVIVSLKAECFPEMVRHGYINCTACHVSPTGGGLMSTYGRSMSKEVLSRWSYEGEERVLHGAIAQENINSWIDGSREVGFNIGGDVRFIQTYRNSDVIEQGHFFPMQRDLEAGFRFYDFTVVASYGLKYKQGVEDEADIRRAYVLYQASESLSLRAGRFLPAFGINVPDHYLNIKRGLGFDQNKERDAIELNYIVDRWQTTLSASQSPESLAVSQQEEAYSAQLHYAFSDKYKLGISYWRGEFEETKRNIMGLHGIWGFSHSLYMLTEVDYQTQINATTNFITKGLFYYLKTGYEFSRGWHAIAQWEGGQSNLDNERTKNTSYGLGINFYPRPHWEVQGLWSKGTIKALDTKPMDMAHLVLHYYF